MIAISLVLDRLWSSNIVNDLIVIRWWLRQALIIIEAQWYMVLTQSINCH